ncbi:MAG: signal peptidase I [Actinomycetota bacterium]|nr:signal peptidase I [Actinomycetota bacterium]
MTTIAPRPQRSQNATSAAHKPVKKKGVLHYIGVGLSFGLLSLVLLLAVMVVALPMLTKSTPYTVLTSSMNPSYPAGTLVIVKPSDPQQIRIGDVITYQIKSNEPAVITHRVIQIVEPAKVGDEMKFITKGDANSLADPEVKPIQVRGVVWYAVPFIGWINNVINGGTRNVLVPIIAGVLFLYAGFMAASTVIDRRRKAAAEAARAEQDAVDEELRELVDASRA